MEKLYTNKHIILGSKSPRRIELMKLMGFNVKVLKLNIKEDYPSSLSAIETALFLSKKKANAYKVGKNEVLICADTIVYANKKILGKPKSKDQAIKMLEEISNKQHFVVTAVTIKMTNKNISFYDKSTVYFNKLSKAEIEFYVKNFNPLDKAGGYGIQDWIGIIGINKIVGSFYNVMGLPTTKVYKELIKLTTNI